MVFNIVFIFKYQMPQRMHLSKEQRIEIISGAGLGSSCIYSLHDCHFVESTFQNVSSITEEHIQAHVELYGFHLSAFKMRLIPLSAHNRQTLSVRLCVSAASILAVVPLWLAVRLRQHLS